MSIFLSICILLLCGALLIWLPFLLSMGHIFLFPLICSNFGLYHRSCECDLVERLWVLLPASEESIFFLVVVWTESLFPLRVHYWSPNLLCDCIWGWDLWEVIRVRWGHEGGGLIMGLGGFFRRGGEKSPSLCHVRTQWRSSRLQPRKRAVTRNWTSQCLDLGLPSLQNCEE